jgi:hypothetical protein
MTRPGLCFWRPTLKEVTLGKRNALRDISTHQARRETLKTTRFSVEIEAKSLMGDGFGNKLIARSIGDL